MLQDAGKAAPIRHGVVHAMNLTNSASDISFKWRNGEITDDAFDEAVYGFMAPFIDLQQIGMPVSEYVDMLNSAYFGIAGNSKYTLGDRMQQVAVLVNAWIIKGKF